MTENQFLKRHTGISEQDQQKMLGFINANSLAHLVSEIVPKKIQINSLPDSQMPLSEQEYLKLISEKASKNKIYKNFIGKGYYGTFTPSPILRNVFENPGWYTAYTPYQAEIAQGRMEALLNFQTMVMDLTGMELANASLLDEATAAAEAMTLALHNRSREKVKNKVLRFFVSNTCFPQTINVLKTRAQPLGIILEIADIKDFTPTEDYFGTIVQYPDADGGITDYEKLAAKCKAFDVLLICATDLMALTLLKPPGEWGADIAIGNSQRFGVPMGFGGPHAAFFATKKAYQRHIPGRIIGVSKDKNGKPAVRMSLQTREQHIRRDRATSNICTAQALLAVMASMYAVYHGPAGLKSIANRIHGLANVLAHTLKKIGYTIENNQYFDTLLVRLKEGVPKTALQQIALKNKCNFYYQLASNHINISIDELTTLQDIQLIANIFAEAANKKKIGKLDEAATQPTIDKKLIRNTAFLQNKVFNAYHSETEMMRYIKRLEKKDIALNHSMIPLGSCTMKLNAATQLAPISWEAFTAIHPFAPETQTVGYREIIEELQRDLCTITGFDAVSLQPNSGAQGEYAGLLVINAYHKSRGDLQRNVVLIPQSAHGTNPASGVMAGLKVVVVKCDENGNISIEDLKEKALKYADELSVLMVTYPSTHGVYEESIKEIIEIIHRHGGQVYMDGANMNAQVGLTNPATIGADVCHINLHKTFAIPHGGGGPGMGPIGVKAHLEAFLPGHSMTKTGGVSAISAVSAAPFGSPLILIISHAYNKLLGSHGLLQSTQLAILNANYMKSRLEKHFPILYMGKNGRVAHEFILDCRAFKKSAGIEVSDIAKRLMDFGFHAPTVSFPVAGTLMVEPTESESLEELDRFCEAMIKIREEIAAIESGKMDAQNNVLKNAPHTAHVLITEKWDRPYSRKDAVFPLSYLQNNKFWVPVSRVDDAFGDRNLICDCTPIEAYIEDLDAKQTPTFEAENVE